MKPFIGITAGFSGEGSPVTTALSVNYVNAVRSAGGIPVILPFEIKPEDTDEYASKLDGILFSGGGDLSPHYYNEDPIRELGSFLTARDSTELALMKTAQNRRLPVLGICRGCQLVNVALGGSLIQDIPVQMPHTISHFPKGIQNYEPYHNITILPDESRIFSIFKNSIIRTNSFHHQAVKKPASRLRVTAQASDGIVEALEGTDLDWYVHCLQFHPEMMFEKHHEFLGIFTDFINACKN